MSKFNIDLNFLSFSLGDPVFLNIYYLNSYSYYLQILGIGMYHTTIEVHDIEFSYGLQLKDDSSGISIRKKGEINLEIKERIFLGYSFYNKSMINNIISLFEKEWEGEEYDPFSKNCYFFCNSFSEKITYKKSDFPSYLYYLPGSIYLFRPFYKVILSMISKSSSNKKKKDEIRKDNNDNNLFDNKICIEEVNKM